MCVCVRARACLRKYCSLLKGPPSIFCNYVSVHILLLQQDPTPIPTYPQPSSVFYLSSFPPNPSVSLYASFFPSLSRLSVQMSALFPFIYLEPPASSLCPLFTSASFLPSFTQIPLSTTLFSTYKIPDFLQLSCCSTAHMPAMLALCSFSSSPCSSFTDHSSFIEVS